MGKKRPKKSDPAAIDSADYIQPHLRGQVVPIGDVQRDPKNCKRHEAKDLKAITASLKQFGQMRPILADITTKIIIAGNGTHEAAQKLGWKFIAVDLVDLPPDQARAYALADNRTAQLSQWDEQELDNYLSEIANGSPELYDALLLGDLANASPTVNDCLPNAVEVPEKFACVVNVPDEAAQKRLFDFLRTNGYHDLRLITT